MQAALTVVVVAFLALFLLANQNSALIVQMTRVVCKSFNKSWVDIQHCRLSTTAQNRTVFNLNATFLHRTDDIWLKIQVKQRKGNEYKPWFVNYDIDVCDFMEKPESKITKVLWSLFVDFTNANHTCPYEGLQMVKDFDPDGRVLPSTIPNGDYLILMTWSFQKHPQFSTNIYYSFI